MEIIIKRASLENLSYILELNNKLFELEYKNYDDSLKVGWPFENDGREYFENLITNEIVFVAIIDGKIVGYLAGSLNVQNSYNTKIIAEAENMYILEDYQKFGIGTKLMNTFKKECASKGIQEIRLTTSSKNINAIKFYKKNGFEECEVTFKIDLD